MLIEFGIIAVVVIGAVFLVVRKSRKSKVKGGIGGGSGGDRDFDSKH